MKGKITNPRICYRCKYPLYKTDYFSRNDHIPKEELQKIWNNDDDVQILCCECYEKCQDNPEMLNDRLVEINKAEKENLVNLSKALEKTEKDTNLELIDIYGHNIIKDLYFFDFYHDVNIRYRYIISKSKDKLLTYISSHITSSSGQIKQVKSFLTTNNRRYYYRYYDKVIEM